MKTKTLVLSSSFVLFIAVAVYIAYYFYYANLIFDESLYVEKDSREFELLISESVKSLPVMDAIKGSVKYHYSAGDGNKPQSDSLEFETEKQKAEILQYYSTYLQGKGYIPQQPEYISENNVIFGNEKEIFNVYVETVNNINQVAIYHLEALDQHARTQ